jgi:hypothetical protein
MKNLLIVLWIVFLSSCSSRITEIQTEVRGYYIIIHNGIGDLINVLEAMSDKHIFEFMQTAVSDYFINTILTLFVLLIVFLLTSKDKKSNLHP